MLHLPEFHSINAIYTNVLGGTMWWFVTRLTGMSCISNGHLFPCQWLQIASTKQPPKPTLEATEGFAEKLTFSKIFRRH